MQVLTPTDTSIDVLLPELLLSVIEYVDYGYLPLVRLVNKKFRRYVDSMRRAKLPYYLSVIDFAYSDELFMWMFHNKGPVPVACLSISRQIMKSKQPLITAKLLYKYAKSHVLLGSKHLAEKLFHSITISDVNVLSCGLNWLKETSLSNIPIVDLPVDHLANKSQNEIKQIMKLLKKFKFGWNKNLMGNVLELLNEGKNVDEVIEIIKWLEENKCPKHNRNVMISQVVLYIPKHNFKEIIKLLKHFAKYPTEFYSISYTSIATNCAGKSFLECLEIIKYFRKNFNAVDEYYNPVITMLIERYGKTNKIDIDFIIKSLDIDSKYINLRTLDAAIRSEQLELIEEIYKRLSVFVIPNHFTTCVITVADVGNLNILQWLLKEITSSQYNVWKFIANYGHLHLLKWGITNKYYIDFEECLLMAISNSCVEIVAFLISQQHCIVRFSSVSTIIINLEVLQIISKETKTNKEKIELYNEVFEQSIKRGKIDILSWIYQHHRKFLTGTSQEYCRIAKQHYRMNVIYWLHRHPIG